MNDGQKAEEFAARYITSRGLKIVERNWKTYWCEIDIVATHKKTVHIVEVKHRKSGRHGSALEYITDTKKQQLCLAAQHWVTENGWRGDCQIDAIGITGDIELNNLRYVPGAIEVDQ
ncbi:YraN family protein [Candidatus Saccharibacteria bacterium QS_8_54_8]|nr:MAG: YraN family protein [Candidatus Saccharibacteria bacterium QS_8_54_8]